VYGVFFLHASERPFFRWTWRDTAGSPVVQGLRSNRVAAVA
jgi:hypothetical protein